MRKKYISLLKMFKSPKNSKETDWTKKLNDIIEQENLKPIEPPLLFLDGELRWEFKCFDTIDELVKSSIVWNYEMMQGDCSMNDLIVDAKGDKYNLEHNRYNRDWEICYSFPNVELGKIEVGELKERIIEASKEYIEVFDPDHKSNILKGIEQVSNAKHIIEIIHVIKDELNFDKQRALDNENINEQ